MSEHFNLEDDLEIQRRIFGMPILEYYEARMKQPHVLNNPIELDFCRKEYDHYREFQKKMYGDPIQG